MDNKDLCRSAVDWKVNTAPQHFVAVSHWQLLVYWLAESVSEASKQLPFSYLQIFSETNASATWMARAAHHLEPSQTWVTTEASELFETITFMLILVENPLATLNWIRGHPAWRRRRRRIVCLSVCHLDTLVSCNMTLTTHCLYMLIYKWCHMVPVEAASRSCELGQPSHHEQTVVSETVRVWTVAVSEMVTPQEGGGNAIVGDSAINHLGWKEIFWNKPEAAWEKLTLCTSGLRSSPPDVCRRYQTGRGTGRGTPVVQTQATATQRHAVMSSHQQNVTFYF